MASFKEIKRARLRINDPAGFINIIQVSNNAGLPVEPKQQTAYKVASTGYYMSTDLSTGATASDYDTVTLRISDEYLSDLIDTYGLAAAICRAYKWIVSRLGDELILVKNSTGAESAEYVRIKDMLNYYRNLQKECEDDVKKSTGNSTGRFYSSKPPVMAGGNI